MERVRMWRQDRSSMSRLHLRSGQLKEPTCWPPLIAWQVFLRRFAKPGKNSATRPESQAFAKLLDRADVQLLVERLDLLCASTRDGEQFEESPPEIPRVIPPGISANGPGDSLILAAIALPIPGIFASASSSRRSDRLPPKSRLSARHWRKRES